MGRSNELIFSICALSFQFYGYVSDMKRSFLFTLVLLLLFQPSFSSERVPIWGDFFFDMKRKHVISVVKKYCKDIDYENKLRASLKATGCRFSYEPFQKLETSVDLIFDFAFLNSSKRLKYIVFNFNDFNKEHLKNLYEYSNNNWYISSKWSCNNPSNLSVVDQTVQLCGATFNEGKVKLINTISVSNTRSEDSILSTSRVTRMYFHAFKPKYFATGNP